MKRIITHWLPFVLFLGVVFFVSTQSKLMPPEISLNLSFLHIFEFFFLGFLLLRSLHAHNVKGMFIITIIAITILAIIDEVIQGYTIGRTSSYFDIILDFIGVCLVLVFKNKKLEKILNIGYKKN